MRQLAVVLVVAAACGCQPRTPTFQNVPFACATAGECADGFACVMGQCQRGAAAGGGSSGGGSSGGGSSGGGSSGGGSSGGGSSGGGSLGGGSSGGGSLGGGSSGGGSSGGGSSGGGSSGGGSSGGGSAGGGSAGGGSAGGGSAGGGSADAGVALGGMCTASPMCAGGLTCVNQVCCESACTGSCNRCNLPGQSGRCTIAPSGATCGLFLCDGQQSTCPTTCTTSAGCAQGANCTAGTCQRCWSAFTDDFSTGATQWVLSGATASGLLSLNVSTKTNSVELVTARTSMALPLRDCGVTVELTGKPDVRGNFAGRVALSPAAGQFPSFKWEMDSRGLVAAWALSDGGVGSTIVAAPMAVWPRWLRIEESAGAVRFRTTSTTTFTTVQTVSHAEALNALVLRVEAGYPAQPGGDRTTLTVDNVNLGP
jgi:hypothetical protein